ncbi:MAG: hypothetical protein WBO19_02765 [Terriglobia bacterium]|jgi:hypothetical protein
MEMDRRKFLSVTSAAGMGMLAGVPARSPGVGAETGKQEYKMRMAFGCWINDLRNESMPLEYWPYGVLDDKAVEGIVSALDLQRENGYTVVDLAGLWATYGWPVDFKTVVDRDRQRRVNQILKAAHDRGMKVTCFPAGILNWGFDEIIKQYPALKTDNEHEMNPFMEESWEWQYKIFDYAADNYDIDGYHLEATDQGRCKTQECMEKLPNDVAYYSYVTGRMADHIRQKYPGKIVFTTIQGFTTWGKSFTEEETGYLIELSKKVDCLFDQGHRGTYVTQGEWASFIPRLHCAYGTSGGFWVYPPQRWDRTRWFLPYTARTGKHLKELYQAGGRGVMYYQGPVINPSTEVNIAFGGRLMSDVGRSVEDVLSEVLESLYRPKNTAAHRKLVEVFQKTENDYFAQWNEQKINDFYKAPPPGELQLCSVEYPFGATPGAARYLMEPYLDGGGRLAYKQSLVSNLKALMEIEGDFEDRGRIGRIRRGIEEMLVDINNISYAKDEKQIWDEPKADPGD